MARFCFLAIAALLAQGYSAASISGSGQASATFHFEFPQAIDVVYSTQAELAASLNTIYSLWVSTLASYSVSGGMNMKILSIQDATTAGHHTVQYLVFGDSAKEVVQSDAIATFNAALSTSASLVGKVSASTQALDVTSWSGDFSVLLSNTANAQAVAQSVLSLFQSTFALNGLYNTGISIISNSLASNGRLVTYALSGLSLGKPNVNSLLAQFAPILNNANLAGITDLSAFLKQVSSFNINGGSSNSGTINGGSSNSGSVNGGSSESSASSGSFSALGGLTQIFNLNTILKDFGSADTIANQILNLAQSSFGAQGLSNLKIDSLVSGLTSDGKLSVIYRLIGSATGKVDTTSLLNNFIPVLQKANIAGLDLSPVINLVASLLGALDLNVLVTKAGDVNAISNQILSLFKQSFATALGLENLKMQIISNVVTSAGNLVTYRILGDGLGKLNPTTLLNSFLPILQKANIAGLDLSSLVSTVTTLVSGVTSVGGLATGCLNGASGLLGGVTTGGLVSGITNGGLVGGITNGGLIGGVTNGGLVGGITNGGLIGGVTGGSTGGILGGVTGGSSGGLLGGITSGVNAGASGSASGGLGGLL